MSLMETEFGVANRVYGFSLGHCAESVASEG